MRHFSGYLSLAAAGVLLTGCYGQYWGHDNAETAVMFANETDVRTVVVGEGMTFSTGVYLAGVIDNTQERRVSYETDESLITDENILGKFSTHQLSYISSLASRMSSPVTPLPSSVYTVEPAGTAVIGKGSHLGVIKVSVDSASFLSDESRLLPKEAIALRITGCDNTPVIDNYATTVIGVRYENMLFGTWWHGGEAVMTDAWGTELGTTSYHTEIPQRDEEAWTLTTEAPFRLSCNGVGSELTGSNAQMTLTLASDGSGAVTVAPVDGATYAVSPDGESRYNNAALLQDRQIYLKYKYQIGAIVYHCTDTLTFRSRTRDGVNEWQDENPEHYK